MFSTLRTEDEIKPQVFWRNQWLNVPRIKKSASFIIHLIASFPGQLRCINYMLLSMRGCKKHKRAIIRFWPHKCTPLSLNRTHSSIPTPKRMSIICNSNDPSLYILMQSNRAKTKEPFFRPFPICHNLCNLFQFGDNSGKETICGDFQWWPKTGFLGRILENHSM